VKTFGQELFEHITTVVPYWRVNDEAWLDGDGYLTGIGVLRNYGGQAMILPWGDCAREQFTRLRKLPKPFLRRIAVVVDDRSTVDLEDISKMLDRSRSSRGRIEPNSYPSL
jgi:hypothetical protein